MLSPVPEGDPITVVPPEAVDAHTVDALVAQLEQLDGDSDVRVDCSAVTFMDSSGLRALLAAHNRLAGSGGSVRVVDASPFVRRLLDVAGLAPVLLDADDLSS